MDTALGVSVDLAPRHAHPSSPATREALDQFRARLTAHLAATLGEPWTRAMAAIVADPHTQHGHVRVIVGYPDATAQTLADLSAMQASADTIWAAWADDDALAHACGLPGWNLCLVHVPGPQAPAHFQARTHTVSARNPARVLADDNLVCLLSDLPPLH